MRCGAELPNASLYEELLRTSIEALPLTAQRLQRIREHTQLVTVQDILLDDDAQQLRSVPYIGPIWANRIRTLAEELVSV